MTTVTNTKSENLTTGQKVLKFIKSMAYAIFGGVTVIIFGALIIWSALGAKEDVVTIYDAPLVIRQEMELVDGITVYKTVQTEYLVGQQFNPDCISLNIGSEAKPNLIPASECVIDADFSSGGNKRVMITYSPDANTSYRGYLNVSVYFVRGLEVVTQPTSVDVAEDGTFTCDDNFKIIAHLNTMPSDTDKFRPAGDNTVVLTPNMYTALAVESKRIDHYYTGSIYCGNLTYSFNFVNAAGRTFIVNSERNVVAFDNINESSNSKLTLIVTDAPDTYQHDSVGNTVGYYVYTGEDGQTSVHDFAYQLTETQEIMSSNGFVEAHNNDVYSATYNGNTFTAAANVFQSAVVNGIILSDGPYLFVVESADRTLEFTRIANWQPGDGEQMPTLKLYVTYYYFDMSSGSGVSTGFYVYTNTNGEKVKIPFYMQTWVWDYVPLSGTKTPGDAEYKVTDYLTAQYIGDIQTEVKYWTRGNGDVVDLFKAEFGDIRFAAYNTH